MKCPRTVAEFLRTEAFYVVVVIAVLAMSVLQWTAEFKGDAEHTPRVPSIDQHALRRDFYKRVMRLRSTDPDAALFPTLVKGLDLFTLIAGTAVVLGFFLSRLAGWRMRPGPVGRVRPAWGLWDCLKLAALFTGGAALFRGIFPTNDVNPYSTPGDWLVELFARVLLIGALVHIAVAERGASLESLGLHLRRAAGAVLLGLAGFLALRPFLQLLEAAQLRWMKPLPLQAALQGILTTRSETALLIATAVAGLVGPVSEEMFFRGFLQPALQRWLGAWWGITAGAAFFAVGHMDIFNMPALFLLGLALGCLYHRTRSLVAPVTLHVAHNAMTLLAIFAYRSTLAVGMH